MKRGVRVSSTTWWYRKRKPLSKRGHYWPHKPKPDIGRAEISAIFNLETRHGFPGWQQMMQVMHHRRGNTLQRYMVRWWMKENGRY